MIPISKPTIGKEEIKAVEEVMKSGNLACGKKVEEFEKAFAKYIGSKYAIACTSGTTALHLAYLACGFELKNVLTTPLTFNATINMIRAVGANPHYINIKRDFNIDESILTNIGLPKYDKIVPVHLYGKPCNMKEILKYFKKEDIVEDAAQACGAEIDGKKVGTFGMVGCFSFYPSKIITTGEGGMCVTDDKQIAYKIRDLRMHSLKEGVLGYNYRMTDIQAAIGIEQLKKIDNFIKLRRRIATIYMTSIPDICITLPIDNKGHVYNNFTICVPNRDIFIKKMKKKGIDCRIYYPNLYEKFPHSLVDKMVSIPIYPSLTNKEIASIIFAVRTSLK